MTFKTRKLLLGFVAATLLSVTALPAIAQGTAGPAESEKLTKEIKSELIDAIKVKLDKQAFVPGADFKKFDTFLDEQKDALERAENAQDFSFAVNSALSKLGYSHVVLITPQAATARSTRQGVGIGIQLQPEEKGMRVITVFSNSPAEKAGLLVGDLVIEANGKKVDSPVSMVGDEGTVLDVKVIKSDGKEKEYKITRAKFSNVRPETLTWVKDDTAVLKIFTFDVSYDRGRVGNLVKEASGKAKNLIVDLRSNPGGSVLNLMHFMDQVLPANTDVGSFINKQAVDRYFKKTGKTDLNYPEMAKFSNFQLETSDRVKPFKGNIAVLINGGTGSASEIAAIALQEKLHAPVIGTKSAGAVLVSIMQGVGHGYQLQFPMMDYVSPMGIRLEGNGVVPLLEAPAPVKFGEPDTALEKALMHLQRIEKEKILKTPSSDGAMPKAA